MLTLLRHRRKSFRVSEGDSYTLEESFADDSAEEYEWSKGASTTYVATLVAPASTYTATRLEFNLKKTGTGGGTITAEIWSATGSAGSETPDALLATSTTTVDASGVSATEDWVSFDFAGQALSSGTKYFFVMKTPTTGDTSNYYDLTLGSSYNTTNFETVRGDATPTWAVANGGRGGYCRAYSGGSASGGSSFPSTNLVAFYKLDESSGDALDSSGNSRAFTEIGTVASTTGTIGGETVSVRTLDRPAGAYFSRADDADFDVGDGNDFTISFWAKVSSSMGNFNSGGIFSKRHALTATDAGYSIDLRKVNSDTQVRYNAVCDGTTTVGDSATSTGVATDAWAHYMMVFTADSTLVTYVNNAQYDSEDVSSVTGSLANSIDSYIGQRAYNSQGDIIADVTHLGFWSKALDSNERTALYNSGKVLAPAAPTYITLEASAENKGFSGYSSPYDLSVNYPAVSENDIMLMIVTTERQTNFDGTPPTGWTKVIEVDGTQAYHSTQGVYWKRASASAAASTGNTWSSFMSGGQRYFVWVGAYSGCVTSGNPIDASASGVTNYSTAFSINITTVTDNAMILAVMCTDRNDRTFTWSDGTELVDTIYQNTATVTINEKIESTAGTHSRGGTFNASTGGTEMAVALRDTAPTPLQTRTVTFSSTDLNTFTIDSDSGQKIWTDEIFGLAGAGSGLRLWNGSESGNSGATYNSSNKRWSFSSSGDCTTWWENYYIRVKQDPDTGTFSDWINLTDAAGDIYTSCQTGYNNIGSAVAHYSGTGTWTTHAAGFRYQVEIYAASNRP